MKDGDELVYVCQNCFDKHRRAVPEPPSLPQVLAALPRLVLSAPIKFTPERVDHLKKRSRQPEWVSKVAHDRRLRMRGHCYTWSSWWTATTDRNSTPNLFPLLLCCLPRVRLIAFFFSVI
jgi:hypothetical protein